MRFPSLCFSLFLYYQIEIIKVNDLEKQGVKNRENVLPEGDMYSDIRVFRGGLTDRGVDGSLYVATNEVQGVVWCKGGDLNPYPLSRAGS